MLERMSCLRWVFQTGQGPIVLSASKNHTAITQKNASQIINPALFKSFKHLGRDQGGHFWRENFPSQGAEKYFCKLKVQRALWWEEYVKAPSMDGRWWTWTSSVHSSFQYPTLPVSVFFSSAEVLLHFWAELLPACACSEACQAFTPRWPSGSPDFGDV